ncbi:MAG TPA: S-layer protein [archaeon]|nr:S-layer protein [archaeon]
MDKLILENGSNELQMPTKVFADAQKLRPLLNTDCWRIFGKLSEKASYPALLAKELSMNEQKVYYYIKQLKNAGLIDIEKTEERNGAVAKFYSAAFESFSIVPNREKARNSSKVMRSESASKGEAWEFLAGFMKNGVFAAKIVVGSPDPHGPYKARARDGHLAAEIAAFIGANCAGFEFPLIFLDTMVKDLRNENSNLVILGGPVTNKLAEQVNEFLPVKFAVNGGNWTLSSSESGKQYADDSIGVIEKIAHPFFKGKWILVLAGKRNPGTISAILALTKRTAKTVKGAEGKAHARVVEGLDVDGDGLIDDVEFKE